MDRHVWKDDAACLGMEVDLFFDIYEENEDRREEVDSICQECPVRKICFANGISGKEWGVWGGVYLQDGEISREFNKHKGKQGWSETWQALTMEQQ